MVSTLGTGKPATIFLIDSWLMYLQMLLIAPPGYTGAPRTPRHSAMLGGHSTLNMVVLSEFNKPYADKTLRSSDFEL
jgi:hypothetical protein